MARKKFLSDAEKIQISTLKNAGISNRQIAKQMCRSEIVVRNFLKLGSAYGTKCSHTRKKKLSAKQIGEIKIEATKNRLLHKLSTN